MGPKLIGLGRVPQLASTRPNYGPSSTVTFSRVFSTNQISQRHAPQRSFPPRNSRSASSQRVSNDHNPTVDSHKSWSRCTINGWYLLPAQKEIKYLQLLFTFPLLAQSSHFTLFISTSSSRACETLAKSAPIVDELWEITANGRNGSRFRPFRGICGGERP